VQLVSGIIHSALHIPAERHLATVWLTLQAETTERRSTCLLGVGCARSCLCECRSCGPKEKAPTCGRSSHRCRPFSGKVGENFLRIVVLANTFLNLHIRCGSGQVALLTPRRTHHSKSTLCQVTQQNRVPTRRSGDY
jgi:hypothetical protein